MKGLILFATVFTIVSCSPLKVIQLSGKYPETPIIFKSSYSFNQCWDKVIDIFAQKGLGIKIIDRSSGLIISNPTNFTATIELTAGGLADSSAFLAVPSIVINGKRQPLSGGIRLGAYAPEKKLIVLDVQGEWNVRIKATDTGSTINVNINNVSYRDYDIYSKTYYQKQLTQYKSTGVFEEVLSKMINE